MYFLIFVLLQDVHIQAVQYNETITLGVRCVSLSFFEGLAFVHRECCGVLLALLSFMALPLTNYTSVTKPTLGDKSSFLGPNHSQLLPSRS